MLLSFLSALFLSTEIIKEKKEPHIPAENWRNEELMNKDKLNPDVTPEQFMNNVKSGKYWMSDADYKAYQESKSTYTFHKPKIKIEGDYVLLGFDSVKPYYREFNFKRVCKSLDKHGKVEIQKNTPTGSQNTDTKINEAYDELIQKIREHYDGKINIHKKGNCGHILIELISTSDNKL